jgi:hypothetical protein
MFADLFIAIFVELFKEFEVEKFLQRFGKTFLLIGVAEAAVVAGVATDGAVHLVFDVFDRFHRLDRFYRLDRFDRYQRLLFEKDDRLKNLDQGLDAGLSGLKGPC